ncbi:MAG: efflux RND transporter periplasmic adaptor subunit [Deltaproteobacteria bacterium]|nr:efflux RND transporter periplasmic adaptor subunit [Deltaproteobacteria bacterium]MBW2308113.1 efflux RND transporter periplasmic adaptor subunit [Deltaproteobacteria bacterium]
MRPLRRCRWIAIFLASAWLLGGCRSEPSSSDSKKGGGKEQAPVHVEGLRLWRTEFRQISIPYVAVGTVEPLMKVNISSKVGGYVDQLFVREGDSVRKGQELFHVESEELRARLEQARAAHREAQAATEELNRSIEASLAGKAQALSQLSLAEAEFNRMKTLYDRRIISKSQYDKAETAYHSARASVDQAEASLKALEASRKRIAAVIQRTRASEKEALVFVDYTTIRSPIDGLVISKNVEIGDLVGPGKVLFVLGDPSQCRLEAKVEESKMRAIQKGSPTPVLIEGISKGKIIGKVGEILPGVDPTTRSGIVKVIIPHSDDLRSGMFGKAFFSVGEESILAVTKSAIVRKGQLTGVYIIDAEKTVRYRLVKLGRDLGDKVEILSGLQDGENVVVAGMDKISDGMKVSLTG